MSDTDCVCAACNDGSIPTNYGCPVSYCYGAVANLATGTTTCSCTTAVFPPGLTVIAAYAFYKCTKLTTVIIPAGVEVVGNFAFYGCTSITSVIIPSGVTTVGVSAFAVCSALTLVNIPLTVAFIGDYAFYSCGSLSCVSFDKTSSFLQLGFQAFFHDPKLSSVKIPSITTFTDFNVFDLTKTTIQTYYSSDPQVRC